MPELPLKILPEEVCEIFTLQAEFLLNELKQNRLEVVLIPAPEPRFEGHKIRIVNSSNPTWYSELFHLHQYFRRDRSEAALRRISTLQDQAFDGVHYRFDSIYRELIKDQLENGFEWENEFIPPEEKVVEYFEGIILG